MLVSLCSKSFKLGFSSKWTKDKQGLEKAEEPEIKLPTSVGSQKKQGNSRKTPASLTTLKLCVDHNKLWEILKEMGIPDDLTCLLRKLCVGQKKQQLAPDTEQLTGSKLGKEYNMAVYHHPAYLTYLQSTSYEKPG